mmetsp:Transcript_60950/g.68209  ORF Transcript_60950/g.68209 Transcript_60950/m.68209 type:complete len:88 (+) Transcript_60950:38-301(+)
MYILVVIVPFHARKVRVDKINPVTYFGQSRHHNRDCEEPKKIGGAAGRGADGGAGDQACYTCGETGHLSRDCSQQGSAGSAGSVRGR